MSPSNSRRSLSVQPAILGISAFTVVYALPACPYKGDRLVVATSANAIPRSNSRCTRINRSRSVFLRNSMSLAWFVITVNGMSLTTASTSGGAIGW